MSDPAVLLPEALDARIDELIAEAGIRANRSLVRRILETSLLLGIEPTRRLDLKIASAAIVEMREAFRVFRPFVDVPKVTVFGSARTRTDDPDYLLARDAASLLAERGWMVVTGAGPGIMQAATEGAGADRSLGVSIRLPFEEKPDALVVKDSRSVEMKYFFTRKLMLVKESLGFICLPGGFGTLDEMFELLTLQQTGKAVPVPIVLLDEPGGGYWDGLRDWVLQQLVPRGLISPGDFDRVLVTDSVEAACAEITGFWHNYDSLRWVDDRLVLRMRSAPTDEELAALNARFPDLADGPIERTEPVGLERADQDRLELPRLVLTLRQRRVGELHRLIRALNTLPSAAQLPPRPVPPLPAE